MKSATSNIEQGKGETTLSYYNRFRKMAEQVEESLTDREVIVCFNSGLKSGPLIYELSAREPKSKSELYNVAYAIAMAEDKSKKRESDKAEP